MSRYDELLAQYQKKINKIGQWIAVRRYSGPSVERVWIDMPTRAYIRYEPAKEFVGSVVQNYAVVYAMAAPLFGPPFDIKPINTGDKLLTRFDGFDDFTAAPPLDEDDHVTGSLKESAMFSIEKLGVSGKVIALKIKAVG